MDYSERISKVQRERWDLFDELLSSFDSLDQWLDPSEELIRKLKDYVLAPVEIINVTKPDLDSPPKPDTRTEWEKQTQKEFDENVYFLQAMERLEERIKTTSKLEKVILIEKEIARIKKNNGGYFYTSGGTKNKLFEELLQKKLAYFQSNLLNDSGIEEKNLFIELTDSFYYLEQWVEPSKDLIGKLRRWVYLYHLPTAVNKRENERKLWSPSEEQLEYDGNVSLLKATLLLEDRLHSLSILEKIVLLEKELEFDRKNSGLFHSELSTNAGLFNELREKKLAHFKYLLNPKVSISNNSDLPITPESINAYNRVAAIFENQPYWTKSLTDFVYCMNELAINGFLKANELEESLSEKISQKSQTTKKVQKLTVSKIKGRKRGIDAKDYTPSGKIKRTTEMILNNMPSKK